jgi:hypothetical protein
MDPRDIRNYGGVTIAATEIISSCKLTLTVKDMPNLITPIFHILVKLRHSGASGNSAFSRQPNGWHALHVNGDYLAEVSNISEFHQFMSYASISNE